MNKKLLAATLALATLAVVPAEAADITVTRSVASAPVLGRVVRGSAATTYSISTSGLVTRTAGNAIRLSNAAVTVPVITISCSRSHDCSYRSIRIIIAPSGKWGDAEIVKLRRGTVSGLASSVSPVSEGSILVFDLPALGSSRQASFPIGMDVRLDANADGGVHLFSYTVVADYR